MEGQGARHLPGQAKGDAPQPHGFLLHPRFPLFFPKKLPFSPDTCTLCPDSEGASAADELSYIYANRNNYHLIALANESDYTARWAMSPGSRGSTWEQIKDLLVPARGGQRPRVASGRAREAGVQLQVKPHLASSECKQLLLCRNTVTCVILD